MPENLATFVTGGLAVTAAGTAEQFANHPVPKGQSVVVIAKGSNTGYIYPGESKAQAEAHWIELAAGGSVELFVDNVADIWIDSSVNSEAAGFIVEQR